MVPIETNEDISFIILRTFDSFVRQHKRQPTTLLVSAETRMKLNRLFSTNDVNEFTQNMDEIPFAGMKVFTVFNSSKLFQFEVR